MPTICVRLLNGVGVWRPVQAEQIADGVYRIVEGAPPGEQWEFWPGEAVRCRRQRIMDSAEAMVAYERVL